MKKIFFMLFMTAGLFGQKKDKSEPLEMSLVYEGVTSLYSQQVTGVNTGMDANGNFISTQYSEIQYFVQTEGKGKEKVFPVGLMGHGSNKAIKKYFRDCPKLGKLIDQEAFERYVGNNPKLKRSEKFVKRLIEIVKYYDSKCSKD